jgi:MFS family permease
MTTIIDKTYRKEKLLEWERKSLTEKFSIFSFSKKSTWLSIGLILIGLCVFGFIMPFIPPRYGWSDWKPATTIDEYQIRLTNFWITIPIMIIIVFIYVNIRNKIDLILGTKRTANFKVTDVINLGTIKILIMNNWRLFYIKARHSYFKSAVQGQIITIKRTATFRLIDYYIRN